MILVSDLEDLVAVGHILDHSLCSACASLTDITAMKLNRRWGGGRSGRSGVEFRV